LYRNVVGLDIGTYSLKAVVTRGGLGRLEVQRFVEQRLDAPDVSLASPQMSEFLSRFVKDQGLASLEKICGFPGQMASVRRLNLPFVDPKKIKQTVPFEVESQVPYDIEDLVLDYQILTKSTSGAEVLAGLAQRAALAQYLETLEQGGVDPRIIELDATALANISPFLEESDGLTFLVDIGHSKTCLCGLRDGKLHSVRTIPMGGHAFTLALMEDLRTDYSEAERRKHEEGLELLSASTPSFARAVERLLKEIDRTLSAPETAAAARPDRIILFGGTARARGIAERLQERVAVPVKPFSLKSDDRFTWTPPDEEALTILPQALGLALRGVMGRPVSTLNLRREEFVYRRDLDVLRQKFMPTFIIVMVLLLLGVANILTDTMKNRSIIAKLDQQIEDVFKATHPDIKRIVDPLAQMRQGLQEMRRRTEALGLYGGNVTALDVLREISMKVPPDVDVTLKLLSIEEDRIRVNGSTQSFELVERLETELEKIPFFSEVNVRDVKSEAGGGKSFTVTITMGSTGKAAGSVAPADNTPAQRS